MFYLELERKDWDLERLQQAWQTLLTRYKKQLAKTELPSTAYRIAALDCSADSKEVVEKKQNLLRQELQQGRSKELTSQGFAIKAIKAPHNITRLYIAFDQALMDGRKFQHIWREWQAYYQDNTIELSVVGHQPVAEYWRTRLSSLPDSAAILPEGSAKTAELGAVRFQYYQNKLNASDYRCLQVLAQKHRISLTTFILMMVQDIVVEYDGNSDFRINLVLGNRLPLYPYLGDKADYATSVAALPILAQTGKSFLERAENLAALLREDAKYLTTAVLPQLQRAELDDVATLPLLIECNLQQGLRQPLLATPADIVYYAGDDLMVNYQLSIWEQAGEIYYQCSMPKGVAEKFQLHRLLVERLQQLAQDENRVNQANAQYAKAVAKKPSGAGKEEDLILIHPSVKGLLQYENAVTAMQESLARNEQAAYAKQFKEQSLALEQVCGNLYSQFKKPPYVAELTALFEGHNALAEMFRRDAFARAKQQLQAQQVHIKNLQRIFADQPPRHLHEAPQVIAVAEFRKLASDPNLTVEEFKQAVAKLQKEVFRE